MKILISDGLSIVKTWIKNLWLIIIVAIVGLLVGSFLTMTPEANQYAATASVYSYSINGDELNSLSNFIKTSKICGKAAQLINDEFITEDKIKHMLSIQTSKGSLIIQISAHSVSPDEAVKVANSVANVFINEVNNQKGNNTVNILDRAKIAYGYYNGRMQQWLIRLAMAVVFGILTMVILAIKSIVLKEIIVADDFTCSGELPVLGLIPKY